MTDTVWASSLLTQMSMMSGEIKKLKEDNVNI
jgi:hypothetical protein